MGALLTAVLALAVAGPALAPETAACSCAEASLANGWCGPCRVGYVASVEIRSKILFETLDAHGHEIDPGSLECATCRKAVTADGFCATCRWGFVDEKLYFSRLTYLLARGEVRDLSRLACRTCVINASKTRLPLDPDRWCGRCKVGMVGNTAFKDRAMFEAASRELRRLRLSIRAAETCEYCAMALFLDTTCPRCEIAYRDGKRVSEPSLDVDPAGAGG